MVKQIGVTASRKGLTKEQLEYFTHYLGSFEGHGTVHHGDCVGGDEQLADIAMASGWRTIARPGDIPKLTAHHKSTERRPPKPNQMRNNEIVYYSDVMLVFPRPGSKGTWSTFYIARTKDKPTIVIKEDGSVEEYL